MEVPPDGTSLGFHVEKYLNEPTIVEYHCEESRHSKFEAEKRNMIKSIKDTQFIIILLRRTIATQYGIELIENQIKGTDDISIRYD